MTTYYIDPDNGNDDNSGTRHEPRLSPPLFANGDVWLFARGSVWNVPMSTNNPWSLKTPDYSETPWALKVGSYDRPGENSQPKPVLKGRSDYQHNLTFIDVDITLESVECHGGYGTTVRIIAKKHTLRHLHVRDCTLLNFGGKGLSVYGYQNGAIDGGIFTGNESSRDLSIPSEDAASGDGYHFGSGVSNCLIEDNVSKDSGHSSFGLYADDAPSYGNIFRNNYATGHNSNHCRSVSIGSINGLAYGNRVENCHGEGMTAWDKLNGIGTVYKNCKSDYGITASCTKNTESAGNICINGDYPKIQVIARHGETTRSPIFSRVTGLKQIFVDEQSEGIVEGYLFDKCELDGTVIINDVEMTKEQANEMPGFDLV